MSAMQPGRRALLRSACAHCAGLAGLAGGFKAVAQPAGPVPRVMQLAYPSAPQAGEAPVTLPPAGALPGRFQRPAIDTDEGGLWAMMDREETRLRRSPFAVRDTALGAYLKDIVCGLTDDHCADVRVHVVRTPIFNATMAPNGMMQVWSGLLLRVENEAQLAAVLGHEVGHYLERHTLERLRDAKNSAAFAQFLGLFGAVGAIGQLGVLAGMFAFSREQEARADRLGMRLMTRAGYDGLEAPKIWENLLDEAKITGGAEVGRRSLMMATHPPMENRRDELLKLAGAGGGRANPREFARMIAPHRLGWLQDEVRRGQYEESLVLFDRKLRADPADGQVLFARGEVYRLRNGAGDTDRAMDDLGRAAALPEPPAEAFRALGLLHKQRSDAPRAAEAFDRYLSAAPQAPDAGLIKTYLTELKP